MKIPFLEWLPDQAEFGGGLSYVNNAIPKALGYSSFPGTTLVSTALDNRCQGVYSVKDDSGNVYSFAGDSGKLYKLVGAVTPTYTDYSKAGGYSTGADEQIEFVKYGNRVISTNWNNNPQSLLLNLKQFSDLTTAFKCRHLAVVRDYVFAGNTKDTTDGVKENRVRWCATDDPTDWTYNESVTGAGYQDLPEGGAVQKIIGGEYATVFQEHRIQRFTFIGSDEATFQVDPLEKRGTPAPGSVIENGTQIYFLSWDGFRVFEGESSQPIGVDKVDQTFFADLDQNYFNRITSTIDPDRKLVMWSYPGSGSSGGTPNKIIIYHWPSGKWSQAGFTHDLITNYFSPSYTLEDLDTLGNIDALTISLDSRYYMNGETTMGVFGTDKKLYKLTGTALSATFDTQEFQLFEGKKGTLREIDPLIDGGTTTVSVSHRARLSDANGAWEAITAAPSGRYACKKSNRYHKVRIATTGDFDDALGVEVQGIQRGNR